MAVIQGVTRGKNNNALAGVSVELKNDRFQTVYATVSDENGNYELTVPDGVYPFLTAVRDYADRYLEYWAHNIPLYGAFTLDIQIDTLEIYGTNAFVVKGAANALSIYFRPMSLEKFKAGETNIAPDFDDNGVYVAVNCRESEVLVVNRVREYISPGFLTACLIQVSLSDSIEAWERVDIMIRDKSGNIGRATLFR